jgi:hypothetical protein
MTERPAFLGGSNIALKVPPQQFEATAAFYREIIGLRSPETFGWGLLLGSTATTRSSHCRRASRALGLSARRESSI